MSSYTVAMNEILDMSPGVVLEGVYIPVWSFSFSYLEIIVREEK